MTKLAPLDGLIPGALSVRSTKIVLESLEVMADIGFHQFEVGTPQRLMVTVEIWLAEASPPDDDDPNAAWDYDFLRQEVMRLATERRYNLQETLAHALFDRIAALGGVRALRISTAKPDIYADAERVGIEIASFAGSQP